MTDCLFHFHEGQLEMNHFTNGEWEPKRFGAHHNVVFPAGVFKAPQGWIVIIALDLQWANVCRCIGRPDLLDDPRLQDLAGRAEHRVELVGIVEAWMAGFASDQAVLDALEEHHVPAGPVLSPLDALDHPHFKAREMVRWVDDPQLGSVPIPGFPWKFGDQPELPPIVAATLGQHNEEILCGRLGLSADRVRSLTDDGVLFQGTT